MPDNNNDNINFFAETNFRNESRKFGIKTDDRRRHVYVVGKTGMGKTVMLENMAINDIREGKGIGFIDPHGEAAERLLNFIPSDRINDVVYVNPADIDYPISFNVMEKVDLDHRHLVAGGLMGVFKKIWPDVWSARMEYILHNCILALLEYPGSTLLGVNRMLADSDYRKKVVDRITDPVIKSFWVQEFARYTQRYEVEATAAIQNKVGQFISAPLIRNIIGQTRSSINMREIMDSKKILIANLSKGRVGEDNSTLLGALLITKLQLSAMSRVDMPESEREDFFLYVDEFQNFATESFVNVLSEARKYRLALILAHQYISQMEENVRDAVFGNVGTLISFRIGAEDAEFLEREFSPNFTAEDMVNLGKYNIYLKLMIDGISGKPFSANTLAPYPEERESNCSKIIRASRERYGTLKKDVEKKISDWAEQVGTSQEQIKDPLRLYDAKCSKCGKEIKLTFLPDGVRPVYCKSCLKKIEEGKQTEGKQMEEKQIEGKRIEEKGIEKNLAISLKEAVDKKPVSFSSHERFDKEKKKVKRKQIDKEELKKVLEESLSETKLDKGEKREISKKGILKPGEKVEF